MKKGIIVAITVVICAVLAATYTFANPSAKAAKTDPTTKEKEVKEVTTTEKKNNYGSNNRVQKGSDRGRDIRRICNRSRRG